jgi:hypothetical protein
MLAVDHFIITSIGEEWLTEKARTFMPVSVPEMQAPAISASHSFEVREIHPGINERLATDTEYRLLLEPRGGLS